MIVITPRLELIAATPEMLASEIADPVAFATSLGAKLPPDWPPGEYDRGAQNLFLGILEANPGMTGWIVRYMITRHDVVGERTMIGALGFGGSPDEDGQTMMGYSVCEAHRNQGFTTEAVAGLLGWASNDATLKKVVAETFAHLPASIRVLEKSGFERAGEPSQPDAIRFERRF